ncbi:hypothetical protein ER308_19375 [Egibacter rhizosphaerae]|uniref:Solute-binding protein family 5 domain-containing protein n=1 Tax=Egibacter rhizosphaerae TaxID=1670831 RepID=A0A411YK04_9ACTN|nr:ABC transporter substrate-binding protein [Egibacter rhizosphaerae]QBI21517.1 hypothetical protein ER308_19375 [Egibacter rhizosphaerae]
MSARHLLLLLAAFVLSLAIVACEGEPQDPDADPADPEDPDEEAAEDPDDPDEDDPEDDDPDDEPDDEADEEADEGGDLVVGTTDEASSLDPAAVYDTQSSQILFNAGETLVGFEPGETDVSPFLAEDLPDISDDGLTYTFELREGVEFHDGSEMTSEDVQFSLERSINMNHPLGAGFLLEHVEEIETPDDYTVEITLSEPNVTFLPRLAYTVGTIIPADGDYEAPDEFLDEDAEEEADDFVNEDFVGTGRYEIEEWREGESMTLVANDDYHGDPPANDRVRIQFYQESSQMRLALESDEIDVAFRDLSPDEQTDLADLEGVQAIEGEGASIRYVVLNPELEPFDDPDVRRAFAAAMDRDRLIENVFQGFGDPLYSMIATGFDEYEPEFEQYDDAEPEDFIDEPVELTLWHETGDHYGPTEPSFAEEISRMLEESGMFEVQTDSSEWAQFQDEAFGADPNYPAFLLGWYPSYFDADYYIEPFYHSGGFLGFYADDEMDEMIAAQQQVDDPDSEERAEIFADIQEVAVEETPLIPLVEEQPVAFAREGVSGIEETMDVMQIFRFWLISPGDEGA